MMRQHAVGSDRARRTTPTTQSTSSDARIGVRVFADSVLVGVIRIERCSNVAIASEALEP
jgi:hypothetical protein